MRAPGEGVRYCVRTPAGEEIGPLSASELLLRAPTWPAGTQATVSRLPAWRPLEEYLSLVSIDLTARNESN